jgi:structural maintenance of chromosome 1
MDDLRTRRTDLEESLATIKRDRVLATNDLLSFEVELRRVVSILNSTKADLEAAKKRKDHSSQQASLKAKTASKLKDKVDALQKTLDDVERQLESVRSRIAAQQDSIFAPFCASVGINSIRELEQSHSAHQEFMHKLQELSEQRASLQAQLAYEERRDFASVRTKMDAELSKLERELQDKTAEVQHIETTREALNVKVDSVQATLVTLKEQKRKELERVRAASSLLATTSAELDSLRKLISGIELSLERHRVHLHETLRMAAIEEIKLPTVISDDESQVSGSDASLRWEGSLRSEDAVGSQASSVHFSRGSDAVVTRDTRRLVFNVLYFVCILYCNNCE